MAESGQMEVPTLDMDAAADEIAGSVEPQTVADSPGKTATGDSNDGAPAPVASEPTAPDAKTPASTALGGGQPAPDANIGLAEPPDSLRGEIKEMWAKLDPQVKEEFVKRENDFRNGMRQLQEQTRQPVELAEGFTKLVEPYAEAMEQYNVNPINHISNLLQAHAVLMFGRPEQKLDIINGLCRDAGIDLRGLATGQQPFVDQSVQSLQHELAQLRSTVSSVTGQLSQAEVQKMEQQIWEFGNDEVAHPDFWQVAPVMVSLFQSNPRLSLEEAYKQALVADPVARQKVVEREVAARAKADAERAKKSQRARGVKVTSGAEGRPASFSNDLDDTLKSALEDIKSR